MLKKDNESIITFKREGFLTLDDKTKISYFEEDLEVCTQNKDDGFYKDNEENSSNEEYLENELMLFWKAFIIYHLNISKLCKSKALVGPNLITDRRK